MGNPFTIKIFYPDGDPENMRVATQANWTGTLFYISRDFWQRRDSWQEEANIYKDHLKHSGIYILTGNNEDIDNNDDLQSVYIGQAENLFIRIEQHNREKTFWKTVVCVTNPSRDFNIAHFRWAEAELIENARKIDRCNLQNGNTPQKPKIAKAEEVEIKLFLDKVIQILPVVEINVFSEPKTVKTPFTLPSSTIHIPFASPLTQEERDQQDKQRLEQDKTPSIQEKVLISLQKTEGIELRKRSRATLYDKTQKIRICCIFSRNHGDESNKSYWFVFHKTQQSFLEGGEKGYLTLCLEGHSQAIKIPIEKIKATTNQLNPRMDQGEVSGWHIHVIEKEGKFYLKLKEGAEPLDISSYLFNLE